LTSKTKISTESTRCSEQRCLVLYATKLTSTGH